MALSSYEKWLAEEKKREKTEYTKGYDYWLKHHDKKGQV